MRRENDANREPLMFMLDRMRSILKEVTAGHCGAYHQSPQIVRLKQITSSKLA